MARYNTAPQTLAVTGAQTFTYAFTGGIISLTGTPGYTVTLVSPVFFPGSRQTFYNATADMITLATAAGQFKGNGVSLGTEIEIPTNSTYTLTSDGTDYVLTSALAGTTVFELPVSFNDVLNADGAVELNPADFNVEIKPTGTGTVDISPQSSVSIQPGAQVTIRPTGNASISSASGTVSVGDAGKTTSILGNISAITDGQTVTLSPTGTGTVTIDPGGNASIDAGGTLSITSTTAGNITNMNIGSSNPGTGAFTSLTASGNATMSSSTASTSTTSGALVVTGGLGVGGAIYAGSIQNTPIGSTTRSSGAFTSVAANAASSFTANVASTNTTTGTVVITGGLGVSGAIYAGSLQNTAIGSTTRSTGAFTTLTANSTVTVTATTASTSVDTGALQVDGGVGINGALWAGSLQGTPIGSSTRSTGAFTTLTANSTVTFSPANANVTLSPSGTGTVTLSPAGGGSINNMSIGATTASTGRFTTLTTTSTVTLSPAADVILKPTGTNNTVEIAPGTTAGNIDRMNIGATTRGTAAFTTLAANSTVSFTANSGATSTTTGTLRVTGGVGISQNCYVGGTMSAASIAETSSITLKENINPIEDALNAITQLEGVVYDRKDGSSKNEAGLIAEDVFKILPNLVKTDTKGKPESIMYSKLTAYLIEAVKTLKSEIDTLKGK